LNGIETGNFIYALGWRLCCQVLKFLGRPELYRFERFPLRGPAIIAANHVSYLDPFVIGVCVMRELHFMARHDVFVPVLRPILRVLNAFPVRRGEPDLGSLKHALRILAQGNALLLFPEGTRTPDGEIHAAKRGVGFLARRSGAPVVPLYVSGMEHILGRHQRIPSRHQLRIIFGEPRRYPSDNDMTAIADDVVAAIRGLRSELATLTPSECTRLF